MSNTIRVWSIQPALVYDILQQDGVFHCDYKKSSFCDDSNFHDAYDWLVKRMKEKIGDPPQGVSYPIWAWYMYYGRNKPVDLRRIKRYTKVGAKMVCIELELPLQSVVLSEFDDWNSVLNKGYLDTSLNKEEWIEQHKAFDALPSDQKDKILKESWEKIFDITPFENDWSTRGIFVQATFWEMKLDQVRKVRRFIK